MRLRYIFQGQNKPIHPFYIKSQWDSPVQPSVALETYLEEVKQQIAEIKIAKPKQNLSRKDAIKRRSDLNLKKADKESTLVFMDKQDKIQEGQVQINDLNNYRPLNNPMVTQTQKKCLA